MNGEGTWEWTPGMLIFWGVGWAKYVHFAIVLQTVSETTGEFERVMCLEILQSHGHWYSKEIDANMTTKRQTITSVTHGPNKTNIYPFQTRLFKNAQPPSTLKSAKGTASWQFPSTEAASPSCTKTWWMADGSAPEKHHLKKQFDKCIFFLPGHPEGLPTKRRYT